MMRLPCPPLLLLAVALAFPQGAAAQPTPPELDFNALIASKLAPGARLARFLDEIPNVHLRFDSDRDGAITSADRDRSRQPYVAVERVALVTLFLSADFDGDGAVTREELLRHRTFLGRILLRGDGPDIEARRRQQVAERFAASMRADLNGDGRIDWPEIVAYAKGQAEARQLGLDPIYQDLLGLDADGDGRTTLAEFKAAMEKRFAEVDADGDGIITRSEFDAYWQRIGRPTPQVVEIQLSDQEKLAESCALPRASKDAKIVLFNAHDAEGLSSAAIGSQDEVTKATRVTIEPGAEPLYLVMLTHGRIIWQFEGAIGRVKRVVLVAMAGATGLPKDVVAFGGSGNCRTSWLNLYDQHPDIVRAYSGLLFGRGPDVVAEIKEDVWNLRLPSGQVSEPTEVEQRRTFPINNPTAIDLNHVRKTLLSYSRGGVVPIDPAAVVAAQPVARYEVLPKQAGLLQLMLDGALERNQQREYVIRRAMRFPAGLSGGNSVSFRLLKGVPIPTGDPGHSKVWSEDAGAPLCLSDHCKQPPK